MNVAFIGWLLKGKCSNHGEESSCLNERVLVTLKDCSLASKSLENLPF